MLDYRCFFFCNSDALRAINKPNICNVTVRLVPILRWEPLLIVAGSIIGRLIALEVVGFFPGALQA